MTSDERPAEHKVLLVDDDNAVREMMTATLEHKGFEVVAAANVSEALRFITTQNFDVLITDLHMPNPVMDSRWSARCATLNPMHLRCWSAAIQMCGAPWTPSFWKRTKSSSNHSKSSDFPNSSAKRCSLANLHHDWKRKESARYCNAACPLSSKIG